MQMMVVVRKYCMDDMDHYSPSVYINVTVINSVISATENLPQINHTYCPVAFYKKKI